jgi:S-formylglutathione hydrolase FrmB
VFPTSPSNRWRLVFLALASTICANAGWGRHQQVAWSRWPSIISVSRDVKLRRELLSHLVRQMLAFSGTQIWDSSDHQKTNRQTNGGAQRFLRPGMTHPWSQLALNSHSTLSFASTTCAWTVWNETSETLYQRNAHLGLNPSLFPECFTFRSPGTFG